MKFLSWNKDKWGSEQGSILKEDKLEHFLLAIMGTSFMLSLNLGFYALLVMFILGLGWEIYNGIVPWDKIHIQGFSFKDLLADIFGIIASGLVYLIIQRFTGSFFIEIITVIAGLAIFVFNILYSGE